MPLLASCGLFSPSPIVRFRLNIVATINGRPARASNVFEVRYKDYRGWDWSGVVGPWPGFVSGNALMLDPASGGTLFFLWGASEVLNQGGFLGEQNMLLKAMPRSPDNWPPKPELFERLKRQPGEYAVDEHQWPVMVCCRNLGDIQSAEYVRPEQLAAIYGGESHIDRVSFRFTEEPPTQGIETRLPWWNLLETFEVPAGRSVSKLPAYILLQRRNFKPDKERVSL